MDLNTKNFNNVELSSVPTIAQQQLLMMIVDELKVVTLLLKELSEKPIVLEEPEVEEKRGIISRFFNW